MNFKAINKKTKEEYIDFCLTIWPDGSGNIYLPETQEKIELSELELILPKI